MTTSAPPRPKKKTTDLRSLDWETLLDKALRAGRDYELRRQVDAEMRLRVAEGFRYEKRCPIRMFHH